jgi:hypothetical protein
MVAFEMARLLKAQSEAVALLVLSTRLLPVASKDGRLTGIISPKE